MCYTASVNGRFYPFDNADVIIDCLVAYGIEYSDAKDIYDGIAKKAYDDGVEAMEKSSVDKDDYERACDGVNSELDDLWNEVNNLRGPSKKNMTRADIANRIANCLDNINDINGCLL